MVDDKKLRELGEKPVLSLLMQYAVPAIVAMVASSLYNIIDGVFIGQGVGPGAIMGLALTLPVMNISAAFGAMVGVGGSTLMSVKLGEKDYKIVAVPLNDPHFNCYNDISEFPSHLSEEIKHFFKVYKYLEGIETNIKTIDGREEAEKIIQECIDEYKKLD